MFFFHVSYQCALVVARLHKGGSRAFARIVEMKVMLLPLSTLFTNASIILFPAQRSYAEKLCGEGNRMERCKNLSGDYLVRPSFCVLVERHQETLSRPRPGRSFCPLTIIKSEDPARRSLTS